MMVKVRNNGRLALLHLFTFCEKQPKSGAATVHNQHATECIQAGKAPSSGGGLELIETSDQRVVSVPTNPRRKVKALFWDKHMSLIASPTPSLNW